MKKPLFIFFVLSYLLLISHMLFDFAYWYFSLILSGLLLVAVYYYSVVNMINRTFTGDLILNVKRPRLRMTYLSMAVFLFVLFSLVPEKYIKHKEIVMLVFITVLTLADLIFFIYQRLKKPARLVVSGNDLFFNEIRLHQFDLGKLTHVERNLSMFSERLSLRFDKGKVRGLDINPEEYDKKEFQNFLSHILHESDFEVNIDRDTLLVYEVDYIQAKHL